jgi:hypothetical protein
VLQNNLILVANEFYVTDSRFTRGALRMSYLCQTKGAIKICTWKLPDDRLGVGDEQSAALVLVMTFECV